MTKQETKDMLVAIYDAIEYELEFISAHMSDYTSKPMRGYAKLVNERKRFIRRLQKLRTKLSQ